MPRGVGFGRRPFLWQQRPNRARSRAGSKADSKGTVHSSRTQAKVRSSHRLADSKRKELGTPTDRRAYIGVASNRPLPLLLPQGSCYRL